MISPPHTWFYKGMICLFLMLTASYRTSFSRSPASPKPRHLTECGILSVKGRMYVLENDVSSGGTCFSIQADDITLNLNGHAVAYGVTENVVPSYGILGVACWDPDFGVGNPCGGSSNNLTVYGGTITQGGK